MMAGIAELLAMSGDMESARRLVASFSLFSSPPPISRFRLALLALSLDEAPRALSLLEAAAESKEAELLWIAADPRFDPIREEPAFRKIVNELFPETRLP